MNILHVFPFTHFCVNYIKGFQENYHEERHFFWLYGGNNELQKEREIYGINNRNVIWDRNNYHHFGKLYRMCDIWVMQYIPEDIALCKMLWQYYCDEKKPFVIVPWGRELDGTSNVYYENPTMAEIIDIYKRRFLEECSYCFGDKETCQVVMKRYNIIPKCRFVSFNSLNSFQDIFEKDWKSNPYSVRHGKTAILVGHRGTITSNHTPVLEYIYNHGIDTVGKIICPLSYGDEQYMVNLDLVWKERFRNIWYPIKQWVKRNEWHEFLNEEVDIAVFNSDTSEGVNTIFFLLFIGKKVFINPHNSIFASLRESGIVCFPWEASMPMENFLKPLEKQDILSNKKRVALLFSPQCFRENWGKIFDGCLFNSESIG